MSRDARSALRTLRRAVSPAGRSNGAGSHEDATDPGPAPDEHLQDLPDGAGCTEIWEHLSGATPEAGD